MSRGRHAAPREGTARLLLRRLVWPAVLVLTTMAVLVLGVFPTRTWLDQRRTAATAEQQLDQLESTTAELEARVDALQDPAVIEQIARDEYGWAREGEEIYKIVPAPQDPVAVPDAWPFERLGESLER